MNTQPAPRWQTGYLLLIVASLIGCLLTVTDPPTWLQIAGVVAIVALVFEGSRRLRKAHGGWRPSQTLPQDRSDDDR